MSVNAIQVQKEVREIITLLMKRPITETIALEVESHAGFEYHCCRSELDKGSPHETL